ncbi:MAG: hypothetical protein Q4B78_05035 [Bacillota bacterium]|nr:hypothetical protein [Bacillota bacterium]
MRIRYMAVLLIMAVVLLTACSGKSAQDTEKIEEVSAKTELVSEETGNTTETSDSEDTLDKTKVAAGTRVSKKQTKPQPSKQSIGKQAQESKANTKSDPPKAKTHSHSWTAVYSERSVQKVKSVPWTKCYTCGADMTGNISHIDVHLENHESNVHYGTEYRDEIYYETESYISGYRCSCGATK